MAECRQDQIGRGHSTVPTVVLEPLWQQLHQQSRQQRLQMLSLVWIVTYCWRPSLTLLHKGENRIGSWSLKQGFEKDPEVPALSRLIKMNPIPVKVSPL